MKNIEIGVVIPVYNSANYLDRCVKSVLRQKYRNIKIVLVDDGSNDGSEMQCDYYAKLDSRVYVIHKKNEGLSSARNAGIKFLSTEYIAFIDSDDWITDDMFEYCADIIRKYNADIISTTYVLTNGKAFETKNRQISINVMSNEEALEYFLKSGMKNEISDYPICIKIIKKDLFSDIEFPMGKLYEDYVTNIKLILKCRRYIKSSKVCYYYFQNEKSIVHSKYKIKDNDLITESYQVYQMLINDRTSIKNLALQKYARSYFSLLSKILVYGFDDSIQSIYHEKIMKNFIMELKKNFKLLFFSDMPIKRKMVLLIYCINYKILFKLFKYIRKE